MTGSVTAAITIVIEQDEGGWVYTNHAWDAGGPTYAGMTLRTFNAHRKATNKSEFTEAQYEKAARLATPEFNNSILQAYHWYLRNTHLLHLPKCLLPAYISMTVVFGNDDATWALQKTYNSCCSTKKPKLVTDGKWGPKTFEAVGWLSLYEDINNCHSIVDCFCFHWLRRHMTKTIHNVKNGNGNFIHTLEGWANRVQRYTTYGE